MHFVGMDVSKKLRSVCVIDADGEIVDERAVPTEPKEIVAFLRGKRLGRVGDQ